MKFNVNSLSINDFVEALCHLSGKNFSIHLKLPKKKEDFNLIYYILNDFPTNTKVNVDVENFKMRYNIINSYSHNIKARDDWKNGTGFFGDCEYFEIKEQGSAKDILQKFSDKSFFGLDEYACIGGYAYIRDADSVGINRCKETFQFGIWEIEHCVFTTDGYTNWFLSDYNINRNWFKLINEKGYIEDFGHLQIFQYLSDKTNRFDSGMCEALLYDIKQCHHSLIEKREEVLPEIFERFTRLKGFGSVSVSFPDIELYYAIETLEQKLNNVESPKGISIKEKYELPKELDTDKARKYFAKAVEAGYVEKTANGYKWLYGNNKGQVRLGYFCAKVYDSPRPINKLEEIFNVKKLSASITNAEYDVKRADVIKWREEMDKTLFEK